MRFIFQSKPRALMKGKCLMISVFTNEEIEAMSAEIDKQRDEISINESGAVKGIRKTKPLPAKQAKAIRDNAQEEPESFLKRFCHAAKNDLCNKDGMLYKQWKRFGDLGNKDVVDKFGLLLAAMGFSGGILRTLTIATSVIFLHLTIKTFCEEYGNERT